MMNPKAVQSWFPKAPALPVPTGKVVEVSSVDALYRATSEAEPGTTILLADGTYYLNETLWLKKDGLTLRSRSGNRNSVILDGSRIPMIDDAYPHGELVGLWDCSHVTVADLTLQNAARYGVFIALDGRFTVKSNVQWPTVYNCVFHNVWVRGVKGTHPKAYVPLSEAPFRPVGGRVQYCLFVNDYPKRLADPFKGDYIGGIDVMMTKDWVISDNVFVGIKGKGGGRGAIFVWVWAEDCIVERNIIIDCDSGICLGNPSRHNPTDIHAINCIMRNNFVSNTTYKAMEIVWTHGTQVYNNTFYDPTLSNSRFVHVLFDNPGARLVNNLVHGRINNDGRADLTNNMEGNLKGYFVAPEMGNLHLTKKTVGAVNAGVTVEDLTDDIDGRPRKRVEKPDVGADEFGN